jgi:catechol 2,3-dioxygenase-like lactoylglutathione lyase family enzyme
MRTSSAPKPDGSAWGIDGPQHSDALFLYDPRGARTTVGIEIQTWHIPPVEGETYAEFNHVGFQGIGMLVRDLDATLEKVTQNGGTIVGVVDTTVLTDGSRTAWLRDTDGVLVEVVENPKLPAESHLHRQILSCSDLEVSIAFYEKLGFTRESRENGVDVAAWVGWRTPAGIGRAYDKAHNRGLFRCALATNDLAQALASVQDDDIPTNGPYTFELTGTKLPPLTVCFLTDPDGVTVELVERPVS